MATTMSAYGITVELPDRWEGRIWKWPDDPDGETQPTMHVATYPLPPSDGDYGGRAIQQMPAGQIFATLTEFSPTSAGFGLFAQEGMRLPVDWRGFSEAALHQTAPPGTAATQMFFHMSGRAFSLLVAGRPPFMDAIVHELNQVLGSVQIDPVSSPLP
jgi:hypothetical protein